MRIVVLIALCMMLGMGLRAQTFVPRMSHADCAGAFRVQDSLVVAQSASPGHGKIMELKAPRGSEKSFAKEHFTTWYEIVAEHSGEWHFELTAMNDADDYDFMLFKVDSTTDYCAQIRQGELLPVRANIARNDKHTGSGTGLRKGADNAFRSEGVGSPYSKPLEVQKGERLILVVDNVYGGGKGHKIHFFWTNVKNEVKKVAYTFLINIYDKETGETIPADIEIILRNTDKRDTLHYSSVKTLLINMDSLDRCEIRVASVGYLTQIENGRAKGQKITKKIDFFLQPVEIGKTIEIEELYFMPGSARFRSDSKRALRQLLSVMKNNPTLKIEIQGHVNQPLNRVKRKHEDEYQELSEHRALAVYNYLKKRGVDEFRMSYKGFGYAKMIYPYAKDEQEMKKNRRVEVQVVGI